MASSLPTIGFEGGGMKQLPAICGLILLVCAGAFAQGGGNAAMTGTVTDPTGAVIANALVTMTQTGTEVKRTASTNDAGQFTVPSLPPATYRVSVEAPGFKRYVQDRSEEHTSELQ